MRSLKITSAVAAAFTLVSATALAQDSEAPPTPRHEEAHAYDKRHGDFFWGISLGGLVIDEPWTVLPIFGVHVVYEMPTAALTASWAIHLVEESSFVEAFNISIGARKFFGQSNTAFFAGGGLAWSGYDLDDSEELSNGDRTSIYLEGEGLEAFGEVGVEMFRLHEARALLAVRISAPFYRLETYQYWMRYESTVSNERDEERGYAYILPLALSATVLW